MKRFGTSKEKCTQLMLENGFVSKTCLIEKEHTRRGITNEMYYYFLAKTSELLDTVFFVLRKKTSQVTFLHVYHHAMMVVVTWSMLKYEPTYMMIFIRNINSFVHVIMYTYYCLSAFPALKKYLWWKKYITKLQLVQFISILIHFAMVLRTSECTLSYLSCFVVVFNTSLFIVLFGRFYRESYINKGKMKKGEDNQNVQKFDEIKNNDKMENNCIDNDSLNFSNNGIRSKIN
ncbi:elongation of very long chain fatty acids protein 2-like isoform X2 [Spodoptera litura]|uniref:Elongation of very long chain fatty acids protein n=1 Tax=Spodoptera litura TaxID=69820 RepID=A0A9J7DTQ7_SPOLT|nr:elongation of very long chain fatty acids protein 2-like isoform X2 [Spodoptera litura]